MRASQRRVQSLGEWPMSAVVSIALWAAAALIISAMWVGMAVTANRRARVVAANEGN